jgi:tRNA dimethylallyltransferase
MDTVLVVCGPTATGKTQLALRLAQEFNGELISADSQQVYLGRDLETGKDKDTLGDTKIWLMDILEETNDFSVSLWRKLAREAIKDILSRNKLPIVVGGSGLYIRALVENLPNVDVPQNPQLRQNNKSAQELFNDLKEIDHVRAEALNNSDRHNPRRLVRAIEIALAPNSYMLTPGYKYIQIGLIAPKEFLINKIKQRVKDRGLGEEYVDKEVEIMKKQITWFKKQANINWYDVSLTRIDAIIKSCRKRLRFPIER